MEDVRPRPGSTQKERRHEELSREERSQASGGAHGAHHSVRPGQLLGLDRDPPQSATPPRARVKGNNSLSWRTGKPDLPVSDHGAFAAGAGDEADAQLEEWNLL
jgi:hypothetical protein